MEEMARVTEVCREQLRRKEREYEESLLQLREQQASGQRYCTSCFELLICSPVREKNKQETTEMEIPNV